MKKIDSITSKTGIVIEQHKISKGLRANDIAINVVTEIASVCYKSNSKGSRKLYDMLMKESHNLPSTSFEFVPIEIPYEEAKNIVNYSPLGSCNIAKYGYKKRYYWITNLRALLYDKNSGNILDEEFDDFINRKYKFNHYNYLFSNMNLYTFGHIVRHRDLSLQMISRRFVSDKKEPIDFNLNAIDNEDLRIGLKTECKDSVELYKYLCNKGIKKEVARGILPQFATTQGWLKFNTLIGRDNFFNLRTEQKTQYETREFALALKKLVDKEV